MATYIYNPDSKKVKPFFNETNLDKATTERVYERRKALIDQANETNFLIEFEGKRYKGRLAGSRLPYPCLSANGGAIHYEISWALVERIANKETEIIYV